MARKYYATYQRGTKQSPFGCLFVILLFIITLTSLFIWNSYDSAINYPLNPNSEDKVSFTVSKGESSTTIIDNLTYSEIISHPTMVKIYAKVNSINNLQAGTFNISPNMTIKEIFGTLSSKVTSEKNWLIIPPCWRISQVADRLAAKGISLVDEYIALTNKVPENFSFASEIPSDHGLEGYVFPDSYLLKQSGSAEEVVAKALANFERKVTPLLSKLNASGLSLHEVITLASIIEREAPNKKDKKLISGVFHNRLEQGISLGADPTVHYLTGDWATPLTGADLKIDSPYNTRMYRGLPPGPICSPTISSIEAAIDPTRTDNIYFLAEPEFGRIIYSKTLEEHNVNKYKYLQ